MGIVVRTAATARGDPMTGRYQDGVRRLPAPLRSALLQTFGAIAGDVELIEKSWRVRWHPRMHATTRRNRIYLRGSIEEFARDAGLVLHEYFHVIEQWRPGRLTRTGYLWELLKRGYRANRFEVEARDFVARRIGQFMRLLDSTPIDSRETLLASQGERGRTDRKE